MEEGNTCISCGEDVCLFMQFQADVANLRRWNARVDALETNRDKRKMVFRTYFKWSGVPGVHRQRLPDCVVFGVRACFPSRGYMGFCEDNDPTVRKQAEDIFGNLIDLWWVFRDGGWELEEE